MDSKKSHKEYFAINPLDLGIEDAVEYWNSRERMFQEAIREDIEKKEFNKARTRLINVYKYRTVTPETDKLNSIYAQEATRAIKENTPEEHLEALVEKKYEEARRQFRETDYQELTIDNGILVNLDNNYERNRMFTLDYILHTAESQETEKVLGILVNSLLHVDPPPKLLFDMYTAKAILSGDKESVDRYIDSMIRIHGEGLDHRAMARVFLTNGRPDMAIAAYQEAAKTQPEEKRVFFEWGKILYDLRRYAEAIPVLNRSIELEEDHMAHEMLGTAYSRIGRDEESLEHHNKAIELRPEDSIYLFNIAVEHEMQKNMKEAKRLLTEAIQKEDLKENLIASVYSHLSYLAYREGDMKEAIKLVKISTKLFPDHYDSQFSLGIALIHEREFEEAEQVVDQAIALEPEEIRNHLLLGHYFFMKKDYIHALEETMATIGHKGISERGPAFTKGVKELSMEKLMTLMPHLGTTKEATDLIIENVKRNKEYSVIADLAVALLDHLHKNKEAETLSKEVFSLLEQHPDYHGINDNADLLVSVDRPGRNEVRVLNTNIIASNIYLFKSPKEAGDKEAKKRIADEYAINTFIRKVAELEGIEETIPFPIHLDEEEGIYVQKIVDGPMLEEAIEYFDIKSKEAIVTAVIDTWANIQGITYEHLKHTGQEAYMETSDGKNDFTVRLAPLNHLEQIKERLVGTHGTRMPTNDGTKRFLAEYEKIWIPKKKLLGKTKKKERQQFLLHNDLYKSNVILKSDRNRSIRDLVKRHDREVFIYDFEKAGTGNPVHDAVHFTEDPSYLEINTRRIVERAMAKLAKSIGDESLAEAFLSDYEKERAHNNLCLVGASIAQGEMKAAQYHAEQLTRLLSGRLLDRYVSMIRASPYEELKRGL